MYNEPIKPVPKPTRKPNRRKKNPHKQLEKHKGRIIPHKRTRGAIKSTEGNRALREYGEQCWVCENPNYALHHVKPKGFSKHDEGRGVWRNIIPLCVEHHTGTYGVHGMKGGELNRKIQEMHEKKYGPHYFKDEYDLWKEGLIHKPERTELEKFMQEQEQMIYQRKIIKEEYLDEETDGS